MHEICRNLEKKIDYLLSVFPIVILLGVRQGGKTTLARRVRPRWKYFDMERGAEFDRITEDFDFFFKENNSQIIIDEAQLSPQLFQELRGVVDRKRSLKNRFILTGSSSFELLKNVSESLPGRAATVEVGTLKLNEYYEKPLSGFYEIFQKDIKPSSLDYLKALKPEIHHTQVMAFFLKGGYPEPVLKNEPDFFPVWMENYFQSYIQRDVRRLFPKLNSVNYRRFISMLPDLTGTIINRSQLGRSLDVSEVTVKEYLDIAHGSFLWRNITSFEKSVSKSVVKMPKGTFRDSGLSHYLQNINTLGKLRLSSHVGSAFESFIIEELFKGLEALISPRWDCHYYRTRNGAEVDLVIYGDFGVLPVEIKFGLDTSRRRLFSLNKFIQENGLPFGIVINNSDEVRLVSERILQLPAALV